jgi:hypothetical protein
MNKVDPIVGAQSQWIKTAPVIKMLQASGPHEFLGRIIFAKLIPPTHALLTPICYASYVYALFKSLHGSRNTQTLTTDELLMPSLISWGSFCAKNLIRGRFISWPKSAVYATRGISANSVVWRSEWAHFHEFVLKKPCIVPFWFLDLALLRFHSVLTLHERANLSLRGWKSAGTTHSRHFLPRIGGLPQNAATVLLGQVEAFWGDLLPVSTTKPD